MFLPKDTIFDDVFNWAYVQQDFSMSAYEERSRVSKSINTLLRALACRRAAQTHSHVSFETACPHYVMLRTDSSAEWVLRSFETIYVKHVRDERHSSYEVESPICVQDLMHLAMFFSLHYCGPRMNALGDSESLFLETSTVLPFFPSSSTLCQRVTYWKMYDESKCKTVVLIASTDNLLLSLFDFVHLKDDEHGWTNICPALEAKFKVRDENTTIVKEPS